MRRKLLDPLTLQLFVAVCEEGSMANAAHRESIVPSAISKRIQALEQQLGSQLLFRGHGQMRPTPAGEALLRQARHILSIMDQSVAELLEYQDGVQGSVKLIASLSALSEDLPTDLARFLALYRHVRVALVERVSHEIVRTVREGQADIGVCWDQAEHQGLAAHPYRTDQLAVLCYPEHPLAQKESVYFAEALEHELINIQPGSIMQSILQRQASVIQKPLHFRLQVSNFDAALSFVHARLGIAILPLETALHFDISKQLCAVPLHDEWATRQFVLITRPNQYISTSTRLLLSFLMQRAQEKSAPL